MQIINLKTIDSVATYVADILIQRIQDFQPTEQKPFLVLGLPTGSTPIPVYQRLVQAYQQGIISFKHVVTFNMDEYVGLAPEHKQSYHYFIIFSHVTILVKISQCFQIKIKIKSILFMLTYISNIIIPLPISLILLS